MEPHEPTHDQVDRHLAGIYDPAEDAQVSEFLARQPGVASFHRALHQQLRGDDDAQLRDASASHAAAESSFAGLREKIAHRERGSGRHSSRGLGRPKTRLEDRTPKRWATYAVLAAIIATLGLTGRLLHHTSTPSIAQTYHAGPGRRAQVTLADGSTMLLAPSTSVTITDDGATVSGEALFTVAPHVGRPFVVRTTNAVVRVLGTRFAVRQYPRESTSRIVVEDGRVSVQENASRRPSTPHVLSARMLALVSDSGVSVNAGIVLQDYMGWIQGKLVFNGVALQDAIKALALAYGADIRVGDSVLARQKMRMEVPVTNVPLSQVLDMIGDVNNAHVVRKDSVYVISPGRAATEPTHNPGRQAIPQLSHPEQQYGK